MEKRLVVTLGAIVAAMMVSVGGFAQDVPEEPDVPEAPAASEQVEAPDAAEAPDAPAAPGRSPRFRCRADRNHPTAAANLAFSRTSLSHAHIHVAGVGS